jgi:hypothetical protein
MDPIVDATRIELVFSACDADVFPLSLRAQETKAGTTGLEPAIFGVTGRRGLRSPTLPKDARVAARSQDQSRSSSAVQYM